MAPVAAGAKAKADTKGKAKAKKEEVEEDKVPKPDREALDEAVGKIADKITALQEQAKKLTEKINERTGGKDEYNIKRAEYRGQLDEFSSKIDGLMARKDEINKARGDQRQEQADVKASLNKMKKSIGYTNEKDIDERIAQIERQMVTESMPLKQEKDLIKEISDLKKRRPQIAKVKGMEENMVTAGAGGNFREQLDIINQEISAYRDGKRQVQEQLKALQEGRQSQTGDLSEIFQQRDGLNGKIQEHIQERNQLRDEFRAKEREFNTYLREQRDKKQAQWQEEKAAQQAEYQKQRRIREAEKLDNQPHVTEMGLVEQTIAFCKSFVTSKDTETKEEKKELEHKLDKGMEVLATKEDRAEEYFFVPTAKKKSKGSKNKGAKAEGTKAIRHNAMSFQFFDKLKLDAPITTDDIPPLLEKLEELLDSYKMKVKEWEEQREEMKRKILEDGVMPEAEKAVEEAPAQDAKKEEEEKAEE